MIHSSAPRGTILNHTQSPSAQSLKCYPLAPKNLISPYFPTMAPNKHPALPSVQPLCSHGFLLVCPASPLYQYKAEILKLKSGHDEPLLRSLLWVSSSLRSSLSSLVWLTWSSGIWCLPVFQVPLVVPLSSLHVLQL